MAAEIILSFQNELKSSGKCTFDGPIGQEYQCFIDYWVNVCCKLHSPVTEKDRPTSMHPLVQRFFEEQLKNGSYTLETSIGQEYQQLIDLWEKTSIHLGYNYEALTDEERRYWSWEAEEISRSGIGGFF